jgi:PadR family transcriptional regulator PadR
MMAPGDLDDFLANWGAQARKGVLELMVMLALAGREHYGYELVERIRERGRLDVGDGTLYTILARLKNEAFVRTRWEQPESGPARKYYALTKEGHAALAAMRGVWSEMVRGVERVQREGQKDA